MNGFDSQTLIDALIAASTPEMRFAALAHGVAKLGVDKVNYGFFDLEAAELAKADIKFMTTMSDDWINHYYDNDLASSDTHVLRVRRGQITPYTWGDSAVSRLNAADELETAMEVIDAGLNSALFVPLTSPHAPFSPVAGFALGSSLGEHELKKVLQENGATLVSIAYLFHNASIRQIWQDRSGAKPLTPRERDCLNYLADGLRQDGIAHAMGLARVTVEVHLSSARKKLGARTLNEAVARALIFGELTR